MKSVDYKTAEGILFTDQYQLTMAQLYFDQGLHEKNAQFDYFFRRYPDYGEHKAGYCIHAGLEWLIDWMQKSRFGDKEIEYLAGQRNRENKAVFKPGFLDWLRHNGDFSSINLEAVPEGRVVHPNTPVATVRGPLAMSQILETSLLNHMNYPTLIATKAARIRSVAPDNLILEFGARRAAGKGANAGARAALIGGADFSSNVGISHILNFPPKGTHAHSMVQVFLGLGMSEFDAFKAYADVYPDDCLLLVDTIDSLESGVPNAINVFENLKKKGHKPVGIRLDSGDLAYMAIQSAKLLNKAGFEEVSIVLSNELDELNIRQITSQIREEAGQYGLDADKLIKRLVYGVGTRLITSSGAPSLGGVYKLTAVEDNGVWKTAIKISESVAKIPNPGAKKLLRIYDEREKATADLLALREEEPSREQKLTLCHPTDPAKQRCLEQKNITSMEALLLPVLKEGRLVYDFPSIEKIRELCTKDLQRLDSGVKRLMEPHIYHVSLTQKLWNEKQKAIKELTR